MSFWARVFGAPDVVNKTVDAVVNTGDKLFFTDEEKSESNQKLLDWVLAFHKATEGSNLARRLVAVLTTSVFLSMVVLVAGLTAFGVGTAAATLNVITELLVVPMGMIMTFYFTAGIVRDWAAKKA